jgi:hypothetical protein
VLPNAGVEVEPNAGAPNAGPGAEVAGFESAEDPNAGAGLVAGVDVDVEVAPHGDARWPKPDGVPNAPLPAPKEPAGRAPKALEVDGAPKAEVEGAPKAGAAVCAGAGDACGWEVPSATTRPGYTMRWRIDSAYTIHQEDRTPSLFRTIRAGSGEADSSISSFGIGLITFSLLERSSASPIADVLSMLDKGSCALAESLSISVIVKTPVILSAGLSFDNGTLDRVNKPISTEAVDVVMIKSCKFGGNSRRRRTK